MIIDLHVHTTDSADSLLAPEDLIDRALELGLDGVCIMEHDLLATSHTVVDFAYGTPLKVFLGVEVTTALGHILVYGITPAQWQLFTEQPISEVQALLDYVQECGGVSIPAHPFRFNETAMGEKLETLVGIFAIEGYNGRCDQEDNLMACERAAQLGLKTIGGSDAHLPGQLGKCVTVFEQSINTMAELVMALKQGHFQSRYLF